jgi:uncharacterized protein YebE (UPF0316 family)
MPELGHAVEMVLIGALIFLARICDVTLGTMRIVFISRGHNFLAPLMGFFEVLIWLLAFRQIMQDLTNVAYYLTFAGGFATGTYVGLRLESKMAIGTRIIRVITRTNAAELIRALRDAGYGVTSVEAHGSEGPVNLLFSVIKRHDVEAFIRLVQQYHPRAFYSIEDVRNVREGVFPARRSFLSRSRLQMFRTFTRSK